MRALDMYIIILTSDVRGPQARCSSAAGQPEPAARAGARPPVHRRRVLRSPRPGPGQVRDAAAGASRGKDGGQSLLELRLFSALVLSSASGFRAGRSRWADAEKTRSPFGAQVDRGGHGLCPIRAGTRPDARLERAFREVERG